MSEPTGRLAYGQAGTYDAIDDRAVIRALTGDRTGMVNLVQAEAATGLGILIRGGWLGVADCGDNTSAVVGSNTEQLVQANPGPPTGTREDLVWCDVDPDEGVWTLVVIPASTSAGRPGLPVAAITVPANATLASQMTIRPADALLDRRVIAYAEATETNVRTGNTWETVGLPITTRAVVQPGHWYRVRFTTTSALCVTSQTYNPPGGRIGIGWGPPGSPPLMRAAIIGWVKTDFAQFAEVEMMFRHPPTAPPLERQFDGKIWIAGVGSFRCTGVTTLGPGMTLSVEDMGT